MFRALPLVKLHCHQTIKQERNGIATNRLHPKENEKMGKKSIAVAQL